MQYSGWHIFIIGVGCTAFTKGQRQTNNMGLEAMTKALLDAGITYDSVEAAYFGYLGLTGIPIMNVNNNYSTGGTALVHAAALIRGGDARCAVALRFDRMAPGALGINTAPMRLLLAAAVCTSSDSKRGTLVLRVFGAATVEYFKRHGGGVEHLAKIAAKNHEHLVNNPYAQFQARYDEAAYMCSPTSVDGAACCIVANEAPVHDNKLENQVIEFVAMGLQTDCSEAFAGCSVMDIVDYRGMLRLADKIFAEADCVVNDAHHFVERGDNTYGGKYVVNPSGGLVAKGHHICATGLEMHFSITSRGRAQAPGLFDLPSTRGMYGLVHNIGLGVQSSSAPSVSQNFTTLMAQADATGKI
ncbi:thiolase-like protein [Lactarius psammicola]|nr:thiolase-like protein [Lactarius psammicola]